MPRVSVITPAYNAAGTLAETITSVQAQTFDDWEMIVIDDGSTDNTAFIVTNAAEIDARIRLLKQENTGVGAARRAGIEAANGRYIAFLDSDDLWLPQKLEHQLAFMEKKNAGVSYTCYRRFTSDGREGALISPPPMLTHRMMLGNSAIPNLTGMIDRQICTTINIPDIPRAEDFAMWLQLLRRCGVAYGLMEDLARYRVSRTSASAQRTGSAIYVWRILRQQEKLGILQALYCFGQWGLNALRRHGRF